MPLYNSYGGENEIVVYPYNDHESGLSHQRLAQITWLNARQDAAKCSRLARFGRSGADG